jgi:hypothetical protein
MTQQVGYTSVKVIPFMPQYPINKEGTICIDTKSSNLHRPLNEAPVLLTDYLVILDANGCGTIYSCQKISPGYLGDRL